MQIYGKSVRGLAAAFLALSLSGLAWDSYAQSRGVRYYGLEAVGPKRDSWLSLHMSKHPGVFESDVEYMGKFFADAERYLIATIDMTPRLSKIRDEFYKSAQLFEQSASAFREIVRMQPQETDLANCANGSELAARKSHEFVNYVNDVLRSISFPAADHAFYVRDSVANEVAQIYIDYCNPAAANTRRLSPSRDNRFTRTLYVWSPSMVKPPTGVPQWLGPQKIFSYDVRAPGPLKDIKLLELTGDDTPDVIYSFFGNGVQRNFVLRGRRRGENDFQGQSRNYKLETAFDGPFTVDDVDGNGLPEIYAGRQIFEWDGRQVIKR